MGILYLVATPLGNLEDMSPRAIRILREVNLVAAEDTRHSGTLLAHFGIRTPLTSYFEFNKITKLDHIMAVLATGNVALISDAGMPAINDPGYELVKAALAGGYTVSPIPGPSAPIAAVAASGLPTDSFLYLGYLPRKSSERKQFLTDVVRQPYTLVFLEAPHRLLDSLSDMRVVLGNRSIAVARELTKLYEEIWRGNIAGALDYFNEHDPRGEFTLVVGGVASADTVERWSEEQIRQALRAGLSAGEPPAMLAKRLAKESGWERRQIYLMVLEA